MSNRSMLSFLLASSLFSTTFASHASESDLNQLPASHFTGTFQTVIELNSDSDINKNRSHEHLFSAENVTNTKIISLMRLNPTADLMAKAEQVADALDKGFRLERDYSAGIQTFSKSSKSKDIGMGSVPVLDQGKYGTCVTFATTAALDAALQEGDLIDQQCTLTLNKTLGNDYWDGANFPSQIIKPLKQYGVVTKNNCPENYPNPSQKLSTSDYEKIVSKNVNLRRVDYQYHPTLTVQDVRNAINDDRRVSIGFMLKASMDPITVRGFDVRVDGKRKKGGLWACKQPGTNTNYCGVAFAGHEVIITGYDDEQQLFKIRNSWSEYSGDEGEFYMTYEFFNAMVIDGTEIW